MSNMVVPFPEPGINVADLEAFRGSRPCDDTGASPVSRFEAEFAAYSKHRCALAVSAPGKAMEAGLRSIGLRPGDGVLMSTLASPDILRAIQRLGGHPILVDCCEDDYNLDTWDAEQRLLKARANGIPVRVLAPTHFAGLVGDMVGYHNLALRYGLKVVEDATACRPAYYRETPEDDWKTPGRFADVTCYGFQRDSRLADGEGGVVCADRVEYAESLQVLQWGDQAGPLDGQASGESSAGLTAGEAVFALDHLRQADRRHMLRSQTASTYEEILGHVDELVLPATHGDRIHSWHLFVLRLREGTLSIGRDEVVKLLTAAGIGAAAHGGFVEPYPDQAEEWPVATRLERELLSLPIDPELSAEEAECIGIALMRIVSAHRKKTSISFLRT